MSTSTLDEARFETIATQTLDALFEALEVTLSDALEADLEGAILSIELEDGRQYILNKHAPNRQLWLSSPVSGAHHFGFDAARDAWVSTRGAGELRALLGSELSSLCGQAVSFD